MLITFLIFLVVIDNARSYQIRFSCQTKYGSIIPNKSKFQLYNYDSNDKIEVEKKLFYSQKSFKDLGLSDKMIEVINSLNIVTPSKIQAICYFGINSKKHCIIADQTGSGKTLAYLLPTIQRMIDSRKERRETGNIASNSPYIVIMTPTTELAM